MADKVYIDKLTGKPLLLDIEFPAIFPSQFRGGGGGGGSGSGSGDLTQAVADNLYLKIASNLSDLSNVSTARSNLGLVIGTNVQAWSSNLDEYAAVNPTAAGLALLDDADAAAQRTTLGLVAGGAGDIWVEKAGDTMTGNLLFDNNVGIQGKDSSGITQDLLKLTSADALEIRNPVDTINIYSAGGLLFLNDVTLRVKSGSSTMHNLDFTSGNTLHAGYLRAGSTSAPTNTTAGDLTAVRLNIGNVAFGTGVEAAISGDGTISGFLRVGSGTAPTNTTAGDLTFIRGFMTGTLTIDTATGADSIKNTSDGSGLILTGLGGGVTAELRIVANGAAWTDNVTTSYFQITNSSNNNVSFQGGTYASDTQMNRLQFCSLLTQITDYQYQDTPVPTAVFEVYDNGVGNEIFKLVSTATNDDPNYRVYQNRVATTDATLTTLHTIAIAASNTYLIESRIVARRTGGTAGTADDGAVYIRRAMVTTKTGTVTISAVQDGLTQEDQAGWDATFNVSGTNILVQITGAADNNVTWHATTIIQHLSS